MRKASPKEAFIKTFISLQPLDFLDVHLSSFIMYILIISGYVKIQREIISR